MPGPVLYKIYRLQQTADGHLVYFAASDAELQGLCRALGHPEWARTTALRHPAGTARRTGNFEALRRAARTPRSVELPHRGDHRTPPRRAGPGGRGEHARHVFTDPQVVHNDIIHTWEHPTVGPMRQARPPVRFSHTEHDDVWAVDELGQSTETVLAGHGYDDDALAVLREKGVIA